MINRKTIALCIALGLVLYCSNLSASEGGPLLISEVPSNQVYSEERIADVKSQDLAALKGYPEDSLVNEYLLLNKVSDLNPEALSEGDISFLKQVANHKVTAYKQHPEGPIAVPIFDIASLAQHKLLLWKVHSKKLEFDSLLQSNLDLFATMSTENNINVQAAKGSLQDSPALSVASVDLLVNNYSQHEAANSLVLLEALVEKSGSYKAAEVLLNSPHNSPLKHQLLSRLEQYFSEHEQEALLKEQISNKSNLASQAIIEYAKLPSGVLEVDVLYANLSDKTLGASSAFALSRVLNASSDYSKVVDFLKQHRSSRYAVANCLLALKLANTDDSKAQLRDILEQDYIQFEDIKAEVNSWLN